MAVYSSRFSVALSVAAKISMDDFEAKQVEFKLWMLEQVSSGSNTHHFDSLFIILVVLKHISQNIRQHLAFLVGGSPRDSKTVHYSRQILPKTFTVVIYSTLVDIMIYLVLIVITTLIMTIKVGVRKSISCHLVAVCCEVCDWGSCLIKRCGVKPAHDISWLCVMGFVIEDHP